MPLLTYGHIDAVFAALYRIIVSDIAEAKLVQRLLSGSEAPCTADALDTHMQIKAVSNGGVLAAQTLWVH